MLKLEKLNLYNWCNLKGSKTINFTDGFNVINGKNGGGKTSIVNAISILLLNRYEGNFEGFINNESEEASIELFFQVNNDDYISKLKLKKTKGVASERYLTKNGNDIASGEDCAKELNNILSSFLTSYSLFYRQSDSDKVTECTDSERRDLLTQLVSIDYSEKVAQFITPNIEKLKADITNLEKDIYALENKTYTFGEEKQVPEKHPQSEIDDFKAKVKLWEDNNKNIAKQSSLKTSIETATADYEATKTKYDANAILQTKESQLKAINESTESQISQIEASRSTAKAESKARMQGLLDSINDLKNRLASLQVSQNLPDFEYSRITDANQNLAALRTKQDINSKNIKSLESGVCPVCGSNCEHKLKDFQDEEASLKQQFEAVKAEVAKLQEEQKAWELAKKENDNAILQKTQVEGELAKAEANVDNEKSNIINLLQNLKEKEELVKNNLQKEISSIEEAAKLQLETSKELIEQKAKYLNELQTQFNEIEIVDVPDCREQLAKLESDNAEVDKIISYNKAIKEQNETLKKQQEQDAESLKAFSAKMVDLKNSLADYNTSAEIMNKTYPTWKLERSLKDIENKTNIFIEDVYKPLYIKFTANKNSLKMFYGNGLRDLPVKRLSGAEKQIVNLAVENVFNQQQGLSCLILDESDSAMDKDNKETFFSTLLALQDYYEQILVITHSADIKDKLQVEGANIILL